MKKKKLFIKEMVVREKGNNTKKLGSDSFRKLFKTFLCHYCIETTLGHY